MEYNTISSTLLINQVLNSSPKWSMRYTLLISTYIYIHLKILKLKIDHRKYPKHKLLHNLIVPRYFYIEVFCISPNNTHRSEKDKPSSNLLSQLNFTELARTLCPTVLIPVATARANNDEAKISSVGVSDLSRALLHERMHADSNEITPGTKSAAGAPSRNDAARLC